MTSVAHIRTIKDPTRRALAAQQKLADLETEKANVAAIHDQAVGEMYAQGMTLQAIADTLGGYTRQRIQQMVKQPRI